MTRRLGLDTADFYVARRQLSWLVHVARMDYSRLPRRMLSCWVAHQRPRGAPRMMYGRSARKALDTFDLDHNKWPELAANRLAWRAMLRSREPSPDYRAPPPTPAAPSRSHGSSDRWRALRTRRDAREFNWGRS